MFSIDLGFKDISILAVHQSILLSVILVSSLLLYVFSLSNKALIKETDIFSISKNSILLNTVLLSYSFILCYSVVSLIIPKVEIKPIVNDHYELLSFKEYVPYFNGNDYLLVSKIDGHRYPSDVDSYTNYEVCNTPIAIKYELVTTYNIAVLVIKSSAIKTQISCINEEK